MSQDFKLRFDEMRQSNPAKKDNPSLNNDDTHFDSYGHVRNLCLIWPDNKKIFFNYAYLVSGEYLPDEGQIVLAFTTHTVVIKGSSLEGLYEELLSHLPRKIICVGERYKSSVGNGKPVIDSIEIISGE